MTQSKYLKQVSQHYRITYDDLKEQYGITGEIDEGSIGSDEEAIFFTTDIRPEEEGEIENSNYQEDQVEDEEQEEEPEEEDVSKRSEDKEESDDAGIPKQWTRCQAETLKEGEQCLNDAKRGSKYCGIHKNYIPGQYDGRMLSEVSNKERRKIQEELLELYKDEDNRTRGNYVKKEAYAPLIKEYNVQQQIIRHLMRKKWKQEGLHDSHVMEKPEDQTKPRDRLLELVKEEGDNFTKIAIKLSNEYSGYYSRDQVKEIYESIQRQEQTEDQKKETYPFEEFDKIEVE